VFLLDFQMMAELRLTPEQRRARDEARALRVEERLATAVPWTARTGWRRELTITADSYRPRRLFDVQPLRGRPSDATPECVASDPSGRWSYVERVLPRGAALPIMSGRKRGDVMFDGDVSLPALFETGRRGWNDGPWMSLTPMEIISLRPGTSKAKGRVVVAGLGLGHQLIEVSLRRQVTSLVLIERDASLVEWLMPRLAPHLGMPVEIVVDDVWKALPTMSADVALLDTFPGYGGNAWERDRMRAKCAGRIGHIWAWGAA
jgi:hypothetical protein